jgi:predicted dehydrogenase
VHEEGALGPLRHLAAGFTGFKRARRDSGATGNDAIHFLDLASWLIGAGPREVFAVQRDHFGRGFDDLAILLLTYPGDVIARIEAGWVQPGRWPDDVVPGAQATKELTVSGTEGALEIDFRIGRLIWHRVRHERLVDGLWRPVFQDAVVPQLATPGPVGIVASELAEFLGHVAARTRPAADVESAGVDLARLYEAIGRSARANRPVSIPASAGA